MLNTPVSRIVIAHQLGVHFEQTLSAPPPGISWRGLAPEGAWDVPEDATVLVAVPPRGGNIVVPDKAPPGWPRKLQWIHSLSTGVDEYPKWIFDVPVVTCGRGANSVSVAEFVLAGILAVEKKLPEIWISDASEWRVKREPGLLKGKTLGLIGYGSIGQAIAARAFPFGMEILAVRRAASSDGKPGGIHFTDMDTVLAKADHLVIALPLTPDTTGLIGRAALARVKPGVHLVNISRGRILDHDALIEALDANRVGFATLDVTEPEPLPAGHPLYTHKRVHLSPHLSGSGGERGKAVTLFEENLRRFLAGEPLHSIVHPEIGY